MTYTTLGQLLTIDGPRSDVTTLTYYACTSGDERSQLHTVTVAGQETAFEYFPTGLLKTITQPD